MRNAHAFVLGALLIGGVSVLTRVEAKDPKPLRRPLKVGVVDIGQIYAECRQRKDLEARLAALKVTVQENLAPKLRSLRDIRAELAELSGDAASRAEVEARLKQAEAALNAKRASQERARLKAERDERLKLHELIEGAIGQYGKRYNYDYLFHVDAEDKLETLDGRRRVDGLRLGANPIYYDGANDMTQSILNYMNRSPRWPR